MHFLLTLSLGVFGDRQGVRRKLMDASTVVVESRHDELTLGGHVILGIGRRTTLTMAEQMSDLMQEWDAFAAGFDYWLHAGTLLGQSCRKGLLHGDDDADVAMMANDFYRLALERVVSHRAITDYKLVVRAGLHADIIGAKFVNTATGRFIDVALFHNVNPMSPHSDIVHYWFSSICPACKRNPGRLVLARKDVWPLQRCKWESKQAWCPRRVAKMCKSMYPTPFKNCY